VSYDIDLVIDTGGEHPHAIDSLHPTYNLREMFVRAFVHEDGIKVLGGLSAEKARPLVLAALAAIEADRSAYVALEPANRWGTVDDAIVTLQRIAAWCDEHPKAWIRT
jgi:hypothetical protein